MLTPADGAPQFEGWHDSELDLDCAFDYTPDGSMRCLPTPAVGVYLYLRADCTERVIAWQKGCTPPEWAWAFTLKRTCDQGGYEVQIVGERISPEALYIQAGPGRCERLSVEPSLDYYSLGGTAPVQQFVAATFEERDNGPIRVRELVGDDGSRLIVGAVDPETGVDLFPDRDSEASAWRWTPEADYPDAFSDAGCTAPISCAYRSSCGDIRPVSFIRREVDTGDQCNPYDWVISEAGDVASPISEMQFNEVLSCELIPADRAARMECRHLGPDLPPDYFPAAPTVLRGPGRIQAADFAVPEGQPVLGAWPTGFHDTRRDEDCEPLRAADGKLRCLPQFSSPVVDVWADAACSQPLAYRHVPSSDPCFPTAPIPKTARSADDDASECYVDRLSARTTHIHSVGAPMEPPAAGTAWVGSADNCQPHDAAVDIGDLYAIEEIPARTFVEMFERVR